MKTAITVIATEVLCRQEKQNRIKKKKEGGHDGIVIAVGIFVLFSFFFSFLVAVFSSYNKLV